MANVVTESMDAQVARLDERLEGVADDVRDLKEGLRHLQRYGFTILLAILGVLLAPYLQTFRVTSASAAGPEKRVGDYSDLRPPQVVRK